MTRFVKLDSPLISAFDTVLAPEVETVPTRIGAVLKRLAGRRGWGGVAASVLRALTTGRGAAALVEGNLTRKAMRLPRLYGPGPVRALYGAVKRLEAALLRDTLEAELAAAQGRIAVIYNGSNYPESVMNDVTARLGMDRVFIENGFFPDTMQLDPKGLNAANSVPRDPAFYLETPEDFAAPGLPELVNNRPAKRAQDAVDLPEDFIFVAFQVPSDMQVRVHSPWIRDMEAFHDAIRDAAARNPGLTFVIKEHPSFKRSVIGTRPPQPGVIFANGNVTSEMIGRARAVITLNSTVGIEGLLLGKPVITLADACYNIEGLVLHAPSAAALDAALAQVGAGWHPQDRLRRQFLGWLWNRYLVRANKKAPPDDLAAIIHARLVG
ncbi:nitrogen fixation protein FixF [Pseudooceanicola sp. CBS1P-1]|uniref:Nitrogen fixation protein FixF n=1 Tax=Pseudooceanicola albus TaxID=2692189 RepID=A0A6L7G9Q3_9RHOB|nr:MULTISPECIES: nitrogen fixation protein FixF [Pseudooceanicola]MBT9386674.1 nitrogen fixation protein FixF [Pseudooceanicola endophyticus]MXN20914.1 nitrogen fixation protein FixF [Pseudooceanicola albus]